MTTNEKIFASATQYVGNNVVSVSGNDISRCYWIVFTAVEFAEKVAKVWNQTGAKTSINNEKSELLISF